MTNHNSNLAIFLLSFIFLFFAVECKHPTAPIPSITSDTTSHNFTFTQYTFGGNAGSSSFSDVAIVNDTLAYAVGAVYLIDSTTGQPDPLPYNFCVWNGKNWNLSRITVNYNGGEVTAPLEGIFVFSANDIWTMSGFPIHGNGSSWQLYQLQDMGIGASVSKAWGTSSSSMYFVGRAGSIVYYNGTSWTKISSGTSLDLGDIKGSIDPTNGQLQLLAVGGNPYASLARIIVTISGSIATPVSDSGINQPLSSLWFAPHQHYYVIGSGIYEKNDLAETTWKNDPHKITLFYTNRIAGPASNDLFACGAYGELLHFNGTSWYSYLSQTQIVHGQYYSVALRGNTVIAVGYDEPRAIIAVGRRQ